MPIERKLVVEFIGTFFLVFTVGMAVANAGDSGTAGDRLRADGDGLRRGSHLGRPLQPSREHGRLLRGKMTQNEFVAYVVTQFVAGVVAALVVIILEFDPDEAADLAGAGKMLIVEFLFTFALAYVVLNVATTRGTEGNSYYGLAIGFTVMVGAFAVGGVSGGAFNPAVAIGAMVMGMFSWGDIWIYLLADFAGGAAAAFVFLFTLPGEKVEGDVVAAETGGTDAR